MNTIQEMIKEINNLKKRVEALETKQPEPKVENDKPKRPYTRRNNSAD